MENGFSLIPHEVKVARGFAVRKLGKVRDVESLGNRRDKRWLTDGGCSQVWLFRRLESMIEAYCRQLYRKPGRYREPTGELLCRPLGTILTMACLVPSSVRATVDAVSTRFNLANAAAPRRLSHSACTCLEPIAQHIRRRRTKWPVGIVGSW